MKIMILFQLVALSLYCCVKRIIRSTQHYKQHTICTCTIITCTLLRVQVHYVHVHYYMYRYIMYMYIITCTGTLCTCTLLHVQVHYYMYMYRQYNNNIIFCTSMNHSQEFLIYTTLMFSNENCSQLLEQGLHLLHSYLL